MRTVLTRDIVYQVSLLPVSASNIGMSNVGAVRNSIVEPLLLNGKLYMFEPSPRSILQLTTTSLEPHLAPTLVENFGMKMTRQLGPGVLELLDSKESVRSLAFAFFSFFSFPPVGHLLFYGQL